MEIRPVGRRLALFPSYKDFAVQLSSPLTLPAAVIVHLPIGHLEAVRLCGRPAFARGGERVGVLPIEQDDDAAIMSDL